MEHHANLVPWLMLAEERGIELRYLADRRRRHARPRPTSTELVDGVKLVGVTAMSNVLGTLNPGAPARRRRPRRRGAGRWSTAPSTSPHLPTDVAALGGDFFGFTGHKMLGPTGIGVLWAREELLEAMPPFLGGGEMIRDVRLDGLTPNEIPWKFEAGTPPIAEAIGLARRHRLPRRASAWTRCGSTRCALTGYALRTLTERFGDDITIHGPTEPAQRGGVLSFALDDIHPHDVSQVLDQHGVCVRAGHHCAKPLMRRLGVRRHRPGVVLRLQRRRPTSTRWPTA